MTLLEQLDSTFGFCVDKIEGRGEDSWFYSFNERAGIFGIFDGCGGSGSQTYEQAGGHTGAYMASRTAADAARRWFEQYCQGGSDSLEGYLTESLQYCAETIGAKVSKIRSSMFRCLPTTVALWLISVQENRLLATSISAGDSRTFLLDASGLKQVSTDDLHGEDAMSDIYSSAVMTNVVSAEGENHLHIRNVHQLPGCKFDEEVPCVLFACSDGCFGYLRSPMEFEYLMLETLMRACSIQEWQELIRQEIGKVAGDDQSMAAAVLNCGSFRTLQDTMRQRYLQLQAMVAEFGEDTEKRWQVWDGTYKYDYYSLSEGGVPER